MPKQSKTLRSIVNICIFLIIVLGFGFCSTREFQKVDKPSTSSKNQLTPEEIQRQKIALSLANTGNREFQKNNYDKSLNLAKESTETFPTVEGYYLSALNYSKLGNNEQAKNALKTAHELDAKNEQVLISLALVQTTLGEESSALTSYDKLTKINPKEPIYVFRKGIQLKKMKQYVSSLKELESIDQGSFPYPTELYSQLGDVNMKLKKYKKAEEYFRKAEESSPNSKSLKVSSRSVKTASYLENGNQAMAEGNYNRAITEYKKAVQNEPKNDSPLVFLSNAYILSKDYKNAEIQLTKALKINSESLPIYEGLALVSHLQKKYKKSLEWIDTGLKKFPKSASLYNRKGLSNWKIGNTNQAKIDFRKSGEMDNSFYEPENNLAYLLLEEQRFLEAKRIFQKLASKDTANNARYKNSAIYAEQLEYISRGDGFLEKGKIKKANEEYTKAKHLNPNEPAVWNAFAKISFHQKKYPQTESNYKVAIGLDEDNIESLQGLIRLYSSWNKKSQEKQILDQLQKLVKDDPLLQILMGRLKEDKEDYIGAEKEYLKAKQNFPEENSVDIRLGSLYYKMAIEFNRKEDYKKANEYLDRAEKFNPNIQEISSARRVIQENQKFSMILPLIRKGNQLYDQKKFKQAAEYYQKGFEQSRKPNLLVKVAECYVGMGEDEKGLSLLQKAERENQSNSTDFQEAIYSYFLEKGERERAEKGFFEVLKKNPGSYYSYYKLGLIELSRKNFNASLEYLDKALILNYNFPAGNVAKGIVFYKKGEFNQALEEFNRAIEKDNEFDIAIYNIGILNFNRNMENEAREIFLNLTKKYPESPDAFYQLSYLDFKSGNLARSERYILKAIDLDRNPENLYAYSRILEKKKDKGNWQKIVREITVNYPSSTYAKKLKSIAFQDDPMYLQTIESKGSFRSKPVLAGNILLQNFGTSLVATNVDSGSTIWRTFLKNHYDFLTFDLQIYGVGSDSFTTWNIETGKENYSIANPYNKDNSRIAYFDMVHSNENRPELHLAIEDQNSTTIITMNDEFQELGIRAFKGKWNIRSNQSINNNYIVWNEKEQLMSSGNWASIGKDFVRFESKGTIITGISIQNRPYIITNKGYYTEGQWKDWKVEIDSIASEWKDDSGIGRMIFRSGKNYFEWNGDSEWKELEFAKNKHSILFHNDGYIVWSKEPKYQEAVYYSKEGKKIANAKSNPEWQLQSLYLSK